MMMVDGDDSRLYFGGVTIWLATDTCGSAEIENNSSRRKTHQDTEHSGVESRRITVLPIFEQQSRKKVSRRSSDFYSEKALLKPIA